MKPVFVAILSVVITAALLLLAGGVGYLYFENQTLRAEVARWRGEPVPGTRSNNPATIAAERKTCVNNLKLISGALDMWSLEQNKADGDLLDRLDLVRYIPGGFPKCPSGGIYPLAAVGVTPSCTLPGHSITP